MKLQFPHWMQISSIRQFGNRVAFREKYIPDPTGQLVPGKELHDAAYVENLDVVDCQEPILAMAETTIYGKSGETLHHYKWADPEYLNLSIGISISPGSVAATARNFLCNDELRTPYWERHSFPQ
jgi:hypothetical protein